MREKSKYKLSIWLMILSVIVLSITLAFTSVRIILGGKTFVQVILEENKRHMANTLRFGHGEMAHLGSENYESLIELALRSKFVRYLAIFDAEGKIIAQCDPPSGVTVLEKYDVHQFMDGRILQETNDILLVSYETEEIVPDEEHNKHHETFNGLQGAAPKPKWSLVGLDTRAFKRHYRDMVVQTVGTGAVFLLLGILIIVFLGSVQRYELAHLSIEKLSKIKRLLGHFVPEVAKNIIERDPEQKRLLDKYIQDATILFLDIEGFSLLLQEHSQEKINRAIESYFSIFLDLIQKHGGDVNETAGDGMMVIFLDSDPARHARNAIKTALEIQTQCLKIGRNHNLELFPIKLNIGIDSGQVYLGSTKMRGREGERWTYTASGAVTILAARLAQYGHEGRILIGEETARRIEGVFTLNRLGRVPLKNIKDSGEVYEINSTNQ